MVRGDCSVSYINQALMNFGLGKTVQSIEDWMLKQQKYLQKKIAHLVIIELLGFDLKWYF